MNNRLWRYLIGLLILLVIGIVFLLVRDRGITSSGATSLMVAALIYTVYFVSLRRRKK